MRIVRFCVLSVLAVACNREPAAVGEIDPEQLERFEQLAETPVSDFERTLGRCGQEHPNDCVLAGMALAQGNGVTRDEPRALTLYAQACMTGFGVGCWYQGTAIEQGNGAQADPNAAAALFALGCALDHQNSCVSLAFAHVHGRGVDQSVARAVALFERACELGTACDQLAHYRALLGAD